MDHPSSYWAATANERPALEALDDDLETGVAIIGAGFSGLATAHHLHQAGIACAVVEANDVGWGASGRNGGLCVLRYKTGFSALVAQYGEDVAVKLYHLVHEAVDTVESLVGAHAIDCGFNRCGHITAANGAKAIAMLEADVEWLGRTLGDHVPSALDGAQMRELLGTSAYPGGYLDPRSAAIHPLNYARGLAAGLSRQGVPIMVRTRVEQIARDGGGLTLTTPSGRIRAQRLVIATNAYTDLASLGLDLERRIVPVSSSVIVTAPLDAQLAARILAQRQGVTDTRRLVNYFRLLPGNRVLYGGRGDITGKESRDVYRGLERQLIDTYPELADTAIDYRWSGKVAVTLDDFPHLGSIDERIFYGTGCGGRGVALTSLFGKLLARMAAGEPIDAGPMSNNRFGPIPLHRWRIPGMKLMAGYYALLDKVKR
jgi:glycine/D-amino acid oxidase-like deaminating enzyme